jgi:hypothetical protein
MINVNFKKGDRYYGIDAPPEFWRDLKERPDIIKACCNGVGSEVGFWGKLTYHLIPNGIWFLDITEASDPHDWMYNYPAKFRSREEALQWKAYADELILDNILVIIKRDSANAFMRCLRERRAISYYTAVTEAGEESFLDGKTFDE